MTGFVAGLPATAAAVAPLPGAMADDDEDLQGAPPEAERRDGGSPSKRPKAAQAKATGTPGQEGVVNVGITTLQMLLAQQSAQLLEAQNANFAQALGEMEKNTNSRIDDLAGKIDTSRAKVQKVEDDLHGALARIAALEQGRTRRTRSGPRWRASPKHHRVP